MEGKVVGSRQKTEALDPSPTPEFFPGGRQYYRPQDASGASAGSGFPERLFIGGGGGDAQTGRPAFTLDSEECGLRGGVMRPAQALSWYRRMSVVYGLGAWTLLGSLILSQKKSKPPGTALGHDLRRRAAFRGLCVRAVSGKWLRGAASPGLFYGALGDCLSLSWNQAGKAF